MKTFIAVCPIDTACFWESDPQWDSDRESAEAVVHIAAVHPDLMSRNPKETGSLFVREVTKRYKVSADEGAHA